MKLNLSEIRKQVSCEADAYYVLEQLRWPEGPICPHCDNKKAYYLNPKNGNSRATGPKRTMSQRRVWKCAACRKQFSVLTGTIFHGTKVPVTTWLMVMVQMCSAKNGISAREIERMHDLTPETAWFVLHRLREAMKREPMAGALRGAVVADEAWIGGMDRNRHATKVASLKPERIAPGGGGRPNLKTDKQPIMSLVHVETGEVRSHVVNDVTGKSLRKAMAEHVDFGNTDLYTDESGSYKPIAREFRSHSTVNHSAGEYVRGSVTTNQAENFFSQLKRSLDGTHHHVSRTHLHRYLAEFDFRHNTCKLGDAERLQVMVDQTAGRRLTYKPLTNG
jgi:transposase-like protein